MEAVVWGTVKLEVRARVDAVVCRAEEHCRVGHRRVLALELLLKVGIRRANEIFEPSENYQLSMFQKRSDNSGPR